MSVEAAAIDNTLRAPDLGQKNNPNPVEAYVKLVRGPLDAGLLSVDVRKHVSTNPTNLLGI